MGGKNTARFMFTWWFIWS